MPWISNSNPKECNPYPAPPRMLKDFLLDDTSNSNSNSNSLQNLLDTNADDDDHRQPSPPPPSKSSFQKLLQSLPRISFSSSSKKEKHKRDCSGDRESLVDVLQRWSPSSSDEDESHSRPLESESITASAARCGGEGDHSVLTAGELQRWRENGECSLEDQEGKKWEKTETMSHSQMKPLLHEPRQENVGTTCEGHSKNEQNSPISILDTPLRDEEGDHLASSSFEQSLANIEKTKQKLLESIKWLESLAEFDQQFSLEKDENDNSTYEAKIRRVYLSSMKLKDGLENGLDLKDEKGENCISIQDIGREIEEQWVRSKFWEERALGVELQACLLYDLVDEVLFYLLNTWI